MEDEEKTKLIRQLEKSCKDYYKSALGDILACSEILVKRTEYRTIKSICLDFNVITEDQVKELENHMKEQYK